MVKKHKKTVEEVLSQPDLNEIDLSTVLQALSDPIRLKIVYWLAFYGEQPCNSIQWRYLFRIQHAHTINYIAAFIRHDNHHKWQKK